MANWLLLHYKLPGEPSASRVYIWRKLKRLGAILYQDAAWVLPDSSRTREQFQWLAAEIGEMGGEAMVWSAQPAQPGQDESLIRQFTGQLVGPYQAILDELRQAGANIEALSRQYQWMKSRDFFNSEMGRQVRDALLSAREGYEA